MVFLKWIEVNIKCTQEIPKEKYLTKTVRTVLNKCDSKYESWHFLWEGKPWSNTLLLRFFGDDEKIDDIKEILEEELKDVCHCYGENGDCGEDKEYKGEADVWGTKAWEKGIKFMELGSEFALELIENKYKLGKSVEFKQDVFSYADRYTHLFLNQIGTLLNEVDFDLCEGIFRYGLQILTKKDPPLSEVQMKDIIHPIINSKLKEIKQDLNKRFEAAYQNYLIRKQRAEIKKTK